MNDGRIDCERVAQTVVWRFRRWCARYRARLPRFGGREIKNHGMKFGGMLGVVGNGAVVELNRQMVALVMLRRGAVVAVSTAIVRVAIAETDADGVVKTKRGKNNKREPEGCA